MSAVFNMKDIDFNFISRQVHFRCKSHHLTGIEFQILWTLYLHSPKAVDYNTLLVSVWGADYRDEVKYLQDYIRLLRRKIEPDPKNPGYILNIRGYGYLLSLHPDKNLLQL